MYNLLVHLLRYSHFNAHSHLVCTYLCINTHYCQDRANSTALQMANTNALQLTHLLHETAARLAAGTAQVPGEGGAHVRIEQIGQRVAIVVAGQISSQQLELRKLC